MSIVGVTGASGYVGRVLQDAFAVAGWSTVAFSRSPIGDRSSRRYTLAIPPSTEALADLDLLVHCAFDMASRTTPVSSNLNVTGTVALVAAARAAGVPRIILVSSIAACAFSAQVYGEIKRTIELAVSGPDVTIVRPGLVYGPSAGGIFGKLAQVVARPIVPVVCRDDRQFLVHESDLAGAVVALGRDPSIGRGPWVLAHHEPVAFIDVIRGIARANDRAPRLVPIPWRPLYAGLHLIERAGLSTSLSADSLLGLAHPPRPADVDSLFLPRTAGATFRPFDAAS